MLLVNTTVTESSGKVAFRLDGPLEVLGVTCLGTNILSFYRPVVESSIVNAPNGIASLQREGHLQLECVTLFVQVRVRVWETLPQLSRGRECQPWGRCLWRVAR